MSFMKLLLPALIGAKLAVAQCSVSKTTTIKSAADATNIANNCRTFTGNIAIATTTTDPIDFTGLEVMKNGGIYAANVPGLTSLSGSTLSKISGQFWLDNNTQLSTLSFPSLTQVDSIHWNSLANLYGWTLTQGIQSAQTVLIADTQVSTLTGLDLKTVGTLDLNNNNLLQNITMQLANITGGVVISQNGNMPYVSFPDLIFAVNMTFTGVSQVSLDSLKIVNQTLGVYESSLTSFAVPKLTSVGGLALVNSPNLSNISAPALTLVDGALTVTNDTSLTGTISFPKVTQVRGAVKMVGSFTSVSMPSVTNVQGAFALKSTKDISKTCNYFQADVGSQVIRGSFSCTGQSSSTMISASGTATGSGSASSTSTGAAVPQFGTTPIVGGVLGLFLAILGML